jgi:hypothetical protein
MKYDNYDMTSVEITYNIFFFILAVAFTVYVKRALSDIKMSEGIT